MKRALDFAEGSEELPPAKVICQRDLYCDSIASSSSSFPSSFSISSTSQWKYDVFLSFRGEDTRNTAVDFLSYALDRRGIYFFKDDEKLEGGKTIKPELLKAIEESRFAVVIISENYASSTWCLEELVKIVDCEKEMGMTILPIFYNVDPSDVRKQAGTFAKAFEEHEKQFKEKVGTWRDALNHVAGIAGYHVKNSPLSTAVESIVGVISRKLSGEFSEVTEGLVGIESSWSELESCLALWLKDEVRFVGIWAMGGMGKTTLAKVAYEMFSKEFEACCFIDNVSEKYEKEGELSLQKNLISQILNDTNLNIKNKCEGEHMIKNRLRGKRIFLVLDDVNDLNQLQKLAGKRDWFGRGSRIIITTRNRRLLETHLETRLLDKIYEVEALKYEDAFRLFCSKAFKNELVPDEYLELSKGFLNYVAGHPLALIVLGSFLSKRSVVEWENEFEKLKEHPKPDVIRVLKISYDGLEWLEQETFKDIACIFNHEKKDYVVQILDILGRYPDSGLNILIEKSLLKISKNNELWMHDLLRDMGRDIVRQECQESRDEPGKRSRLWLYKDIDHVLKNNTGTKKVQAMDIRGAEACWQDFTFSKKQKRPLWNPNAFSKMSNLKFLRVCNVFPQHVPKHLPNSIRYLEWSGYSAKSLPCFQPNELVQLHLQHSRIEFLWEGMKNFDKLKSINMAGSSNLIKAPNFNGVPNLKELVLEGCSKLRELDTSIGKLKKLELLNLKKCQELTSLPNKFELKSLVTLNLTGCSKVKKIPEFVGNMKHLQELLLEGTAITELPSSVKCLIGLTSLDLTDCKKFVLLPSTICSLKSLETMYLSRCPKFVKLPENLGNLEHLNRLCLEGTTIEVLSSSVGRLAALKYLNLKYCKNLVCLPSTICNLKRVEYLGITGCSKIANLPENLGNMESLKNLFLGETAIKELPSSTVHLKQVERVSFKGCQLLSSSLTSMPRCREIDLSDCNLSAIPSGIDCISVTELYLRGNDFVSLPESISQFSALTNLFLDGCKSLRSLSNIPSKVELICVDNCTSLERLPVPPNDFSDFRVQCFNCFKLADNIQNFSNMFQGHRGYNYLTKCYVIPGREIPKCFEKANICDTTVAPRWYSNMRPVTIKKVKIQLPGSGPGCDERGEIVLCIVFLPTKRHHRYQRDRLLTVDGYSMSYPAYVLGYTTLWLTFTAECGGQFGCGGECGGECGGKMSCTYYTSKYVKVESHHLWLCRMPNECLPHTQIDNKGFHQVEFEIDTLGSGEVEKVGFRVVQKQDIEDPTFFSW